MLEKALHTHTQTHAHLPVQAQGLHTYDKKHQ